MSMIDNTQNAKTTSGSLSFPPPCNDVFPRELYHASRQRFLKSYPFTRKEEMPAGKKIKKWFKTNVEKAKTIKSKASRHLCPCGKNLFKHFFL